MTESERERSVYLAGPEVFLTDAIDVLDRKKAICEDAGLIGVSPFDNEVPRGPDPAAAGAAIYAANRRSMDGCDWCIANITPFRGVSVDPGTAFEVGYMCARGAVVFAYSADGSAYHERVNRLEPVPELHSGTGWSVERFGQVENLMIPFGVAESGGQVITGPPAAAHGGVTAANFIDLTLFERCVALLAETRSGRTASLFSR